MLSNFDNKINLSDTGHTVTGGAGLNTIIAGAGRDTMTGGNGADIFKIGATDSLNTSLDTISDYMAGTDILGLEIASTSLVASTGSDLSMANDVILTGTTAVTLAINIATAVATQRTVDFNFWKQAGDTIIVKLLGSSVADNNVTYIVQQQVGGNSDVYIDTRDTVIALIRYFNGAYNACRCGWGLTYKVN